MAVWIIGEGGPRDPQRIELATRKGWPIPNVRRQEAPPERFEVAKVEHTRDHPDARLRSSTAVYNCLGLVFASRRTWVPPNDTSSDLTRVLKRILDDDGYRPLPGPEQSEIGDVVAYGKRGEPDLSHVGIIVDKTLDASTGSFKIKVMSKWGHDGEYLHSIDDVPLILGEPLQFYTDRKVLT